jgi:hypothetical protein
MDFDDQFELEHLFLTERKCRKCGKVKDLIDGFYLTRKGRGGIASAYSYECKNCTIQRIISSRMTNRVFDKWEYPDW